MTLKVVQGINRNFKKIIKHVQNITSYYILKMILQIFKNFQILCSAYYIGLAVAIPISTALIDSTL